MNFKLITVLVATCLICNSCYLHERFKDDIQQGQILKKANVDKLKIGMSTAMAIDIIGSPVLEPIIKDRYDFIEWHRYKGKVLKNSILSLYFKDDRIVKIDKSKYKPYT